MLREGWRELPGLAQQRARWGDSKAPCFSSTTPSRPLRPPSSSPSLSISKRSSLSLCSISHPPKGLQACRNFPPISVLSVSPLTTASRGLENLATTKFPQRFHLQSSSAPEKPTASVSSLWQSFFSDPATSGSLFFQIPQPLTRHPARREEDRRNTRAYRVSLRRRERCVRRLTARGARWRPRAPLAPHPSGIEHRLHRPWTRFGPCLDFTLKHHAANLEDEGGIAAIPCQTVALDHLGPVCNP
jgi:hypothetical protein